MPNYIDEFIRQNAINPIGKSYTDNVISDESASAIAYSLTNKPNALGYELNSLGPQKKYLNVGLEEGVQLLKAQEEGRLAKELADAQKWTQQAKNSMIQLLSEATVGTATAFADLFDFVTLAQLRKGNTYSNPVSKLLDDFQRNLREDWAPIYADPDKHLYNGGLIDSGFMFSGLPSIMSSLTLLIPSKAVTVGLGKGFKYLTAKGVKYARQAEKAARETNALGNAARTSNAAKVNAFLHSPAGRNAANMADFTVSGSLSRVLENYQESRQTYIDSKPVYKATIDSMSDAERDALVNQLALEFGEDAADWNSNDSVAHLVSQKAADRTFRDNMVNIFSDIYQMYVLGNAMRVFNGPANRLIKRENKKLLATVGKPKAEAEKIAANMEANAKKLKTKVGDKLFISGHAVFAELNEGIEEAVNYISQEEGFHYGKVLLGQELNDNFFSDRLVNYMKAPELYDSAFWGVAGGVIFNAGGSFVARAQRAQKVISDAKERKKNAVDSDKVKVPTWKEAFADTETTIRLANIQSNKARFESTLEKIRQIREEKKDVFGIGLTETLQTQEEIDLATEMAYREFVDEVLLNALDAGNYDLARNFLESNELKQAFIDNNHLTKEQADQLQQEAINRGETLRGIYNKNLRRVYNAAADWGELNDADLTEIPAEVFNIIARENIHRELSQRGYDERIARLQETIGVLEDDSRDAIDKLKRDNGLTDIASIIDRVYKAQQLGMIEAQIRDIKANNQHLTPSGQAMLRTWELNKKILQEDIANSMANITDDVELAVTHLLMSQTASAVEIAPITGQGGKTTYQVNTGNENYVKLQEAVNSMDRQLLETLAPAMKEILARNKKEGDVDTFLEQVKSRANALDQTYRNLYDENGVFKALRDINPQLEQAYNLLAALKINSQFEKSRISDTKEKVINRANDVLNELNMMRYVAIEQAGHLYQQLAKKYGTEPVWDAVMTYWQSGNHTDIYEVFTDEEKQAFDAYTKMLQLHRAEQDITLQDLRNILNYNDIYTYTEEQDVAKRRAKEMAEAERRRAEKEEKKNNTSETSSTAANENGSNNQSQNQQQTTTTQGTGQNGNVSTQNQSEPIEEGITEGTPDITEDEVASATEAVADDTETESPKPQSEVSSMGEEEELFVGDVLGEVDEVLKTLSENNPNDLGVDDFKQVVKDTLKQKHPKATEEQIDSTIDSVFGLLDKRLGRRGTSIAAELAKNVVKLSRLTANSSIESVAKTARQVMIHDFEKLLDIFNTKLANGVIHNPDGSVKYVINLENLLRYVKAITDNEYDAQELYDTFSSIIASNPNKYVIVNGHLLNPNTVIDDVSKPFSELKLAVETNFGGRTFNFASILEGLPENQRKRAEEVINRLKPGSKIYVRANYDNGKPRKDGAGKFIGGIDFFADDGNGNLILIAKAPTAARLGDGTGYYEMEDGWRYMFPFTANSNQPEHLIQTFFKDLFTSSSKEAIDFRTKLTIYESLTLKEANTEEGIAAAKAAWDALANFAKVAGYNINEFVQRRNNNDFVTRIQHLVKLDLYTQKKWNLDAESVSYEEDYLDDDFRISSYKESIDQWFNKMIESSNARSHIESELERSGDKTIDMGIVIDKVGKPKLIITKESNKQSVSKAIAPGQQIVIAASDKRTANTLVISGSQEASTPFAKGRTVVMITDPSGKQRPIHAFPIKLNNSVFNSNQKLAAFKIALTQKLAEVLDDWYLTGDNSALLELLDNLGHTSKETANVGTQLFKGFRRVTTKNGNGISIGYYVLNGEVVDSNTPGAEKHILTFYDSVDTKRGKKARPTIVDYNNENKTNISVVWNTATNDSDSQIKIGNIKSILNKILIDSLTFRIDPDNIKADNNSSMSYGNFLTRDKDGNIALIVKGVRQTDGILKDYVNENGDIVITNLGKDGKSGNFSDFVLYNDLVDVTTKQINGSNFAVFDNSDGMKGITYSFTDQQTVSPVEKNSVVPTVAPSVGNVLTLSKVVQDILTKKDRRTNKSKAIIAEILKTIASPNSTLYGLLSRNNLATQLLHKDVVYVEGFNGATIIYSNGTQENIPAEAYAAYVPNDTTLVIDGKEVKLTKGQIVVGDRFMQLLDGTIAEKQDAIHQLLHENLHALFADKSNITDATVKARIEQQEKELNALWDEYTRKKPNSDFAKSDTYNDLEEFIIESLTNFELMKDLNSILADNPLEGPKKPKTLLGKLFNTLLTWLSDVLGSNFKLNKDSLLAKEYAIFEQVLDTQDTNNNNETTTTTTTEAVEQELPFVEEETTTQTEDTEEEEDDDFVIQVTRKVNRTKESSDEVPDMELPFSTKSSVAVSSLKGAVNQLPGEDYFEVKEKINNGVITIKCS